MATGWAKEGAVQEQIDASVEDAVKRSRSRIPTGESFRHCAECGTEIPEARRAALPGVRRCMSCQAAEDETEVRAVAGYNRRGSKDSQLR